MIILRKRGINMGRYYEADADTKNLFDKVREERFEGLAGAKIKLIIDLKPKIDKLRGAMIFAYIKTTNEIEKYLTEQENDFYDYFLFIDSVVWDLAGEKDRKRILSHELRHCFIDDKGNYKIIKHDIEDFFVEVKLNEDDPMWGQALSTIAMAKFDQMKEEEKANK
jgi:hypothetical protein